MPGVCALARQQESSVAAQCRVTWLLVNHFSSHELSAFHNLQLEAGLGEFTGVGPKGDAQPLSSA